MGNLLDRMHEILQEDLMGEAFDPESTSGIETRKIFDSLFDDLGTLALGSEKINGILENLNSLNEEDIISTKTFKRLQKMTNAIRNHFESIEPLVVDINDELEIEEQDLYDRFPVNIDNDIRRDLE